MTLTIWDNQTRCKLLVCTSATSRTSSPYMPTTTAQVLTLPSSTRPSQTVAAAYNLSCYLDPYFLFLKIVFIIAVLEHFLAHTRHGARLLTPCLFLAPQLDRPHTWLCDDSTTLNSKLVWMLLIVISWEKNDCTAICMTCPCGRVKELKKNCSIPLAFLPAPEFCFRYRRWHNVQCRLGARHMPTTNSKRDNSQQGINRGARFLPSRLCSSSE